MDKLLCILNDFDIENTPQIKHWTTTNRMINTKPNQEIIDINLGNKEIQINLTEKTFIYIVNEGIGG